MLIPVTPSDISLAPRNRRSTVKSATLTKLAHLSQIRQISFGSDGFRHHFTCGKCHFSVLAGSSMIINNQPIDISLQFHSPVAPRALRPPLVHLGAVCCELWRAAEHGSNGTRRTLREHRPFVSPGDVRHGLQRQEQTHREPGGPEGDQARA